HHWPCRFLWTSQRYRCGGSSPWANSTPCRDVVSQRRLARTCCPGLSERDGSKFLDRHLRLDDLLYRYHPNFVSNQAEENGRTAQRAGLVAHSAHYRRARRVV